MIDGLTNAINLLAKIAQNAGSAGVTEVEGLPYVDQGGTFKPVPQRRAKGLHGHTLQGVIDYLRCNPDKLEMVEVIVHVMEPRVVEVFSTMYALGRDREDYLSVEPMMPDPLDRFLGQFLTTETFITGVQTRFVANDARADLLRVVGNIAASSVKTVVDDGVTQEVTAKAGARLTEQKLKNPVWLVPMRTFPEVQLEPVPFIVRARPGDDDDDLPTVGLFEGDGGAWKVDAINKISEWLQAKLAEESSVAGVTLIA